MDHYSLFNAARFSAGFIYILTDNLVQEWFLLLNLYLTLVKTNCNFDNKE